MNEKTILNENQKEAVEYGEGPVLVVAGAGTGKTRVITERIRWILENKLAKPQEILALTFTEKAAEEMLSRVDEIMPLGYEEPWLMTFHAFADRILRQEALEIGLDPSYKIFTSPEQWLLIRQNLFKFDLKYYRPLGNPTKFINAMLTLFSRAQDEAVGAEEFVAYAGQSNKRQETRDKKNLDKPEREKTKKLLELANAYKTYQELKIENNAVDFGDLILWTLRLFQERSSVLKKYKEQFKYILADEFQDTNYAQYQLIKLLAPSKDNPNLMVCADDDQAIYRFRGAAVHNVIDFKKDYPKAKAIVLTKNYRSGQGLLDKVYQLIQNNNPDRLETKLKIDKKLSADRGKGVEPQIITAKTGEEEADKVVKKIIDLVSNDDLDYTWKDFAILARANNHLDSFVAALRRNKIPYQLLGNRGLFDQEEVRYLISFLRVVADPEDSASLFNLLHLPQLGVASDEIAKLLNSARKQRKPLIEAVETTSNSRHSELPPATLARSASGCGDSESQPSRSRNEFGMTGCEGIVKLINETRKTASKTPVSRLLYDFITKTGYLNSHLEEESIENQLKVKNIDLFFTKVKEFEGTAENPNVFEFASYLDLLMEAGENPAQAEIEDIDTVNLLTVHSAKGLEFPVVFLVNLVNDRFPTRNRGDPLPLPDDLIKETLPEGDPHLLEERRLFYVGCTRAKDLLFLTGAKDYGGTREKRPSGFIKELGLTVSEEKEAKKETFEPLSLFDAKPAAFESSEKQKPIDLRYISYSQLEAFNQCPLKYKYRYVLGIPTAPSHVLNFGQTLHRTLRDFHRAQIIKKDLDLEALLKIYENQWIGDGYDSVEHRQQRFEEGKEVLRRYFEVFREHFGQPIYLEKKFTVKVGGISLIGSIDRIDKLEESKFEIIDYKTGSEKSQKAVDQDKQLSIYALASKEALNIQPDVLSLYFLETNEKVSTSRTREQLEKERKRIVETIEKIKQSEFPARVSMLCRYCDYNKICPEYKVGS